MLRTELAKSGVSWPTSICSMMELRLACTIFDGIFDGHNVIVALGVDQVQQRGERGAFAAAGGSGDQDQTLPRFGEAAQRGRKMQRFERRNFFGQQADAAGERSALMMDVGAKASDAVAGKAQIDGFVLLQILVLLGSEQRQQQATRVFRCQRGAGGRRQSAVYAQRNRDARDQQDVGSALARREYQQLVKRGSSLPARSLRRPRPGGNAVQIGDNLRKFIVVNSHKK